VKITSNDRYPKFEKNILIAVFRMPNYKTKFSSSLKSAYPFLNADPADECGAICTVCKHHFSVGNKGRGAVETHIASQVHRRAAKAPIDNRSVTEFFVSGPSDGGSFKVAGEELAFAFHTAKHGLSLPAAECNAGLVRELYEPNFTSGKSKTAKIILNVRVSCFF